MNLDMVAYCLHRYLVAAVGTALQDSGGCERTVVVVNSLPTTHVNMPTTRVNKKDKITRSSCKKDGRRQEEV